jgi:hypothetical protein
MSRFLSLLVLLLATCLLAVGPATSLIAAESNRYGAADFPETNPLTPSSAPTAAAAPRAEIPPVVAPRPVAPETQAAKPGVIAGIIPAIRRIFTFKRGSNTALETPPVVKSPPPVVLEKTGVPSAQAAVPVAPAPAPALVAASTPTPATPAVAAPPPAPVLAARSPASFPIETQQVGSAVPAVSSSRFNWLKRNREPTASVPALVAGALPSLRSEARRGRAPNLPRQTRLDMDQRIERLGPELEPVSGSDVLSGVSLSAAPMVAGIEETVLTLEAAAVVQAKAGGGVGPGGMAGKISRRSDEIKLIPNDAKQRERFREVSVFFDPPPPKSSKPAVTPTSSATYETK